jgi:hypothetical protein
VSDARPPGTSPPDRGTQKAHAIWRATAPLMFAATVLFGLAAAIGGPIIIYELIVRGVREQRWSWLALGVLCGIPWCLVVYAALKRAFVRKPPPPPSPPEGGRNGASGGDHVGR